MTSFAIVNALTDYSISTHTLTWSVTCSDNHFPLTEIDFNSHAHVERDFLVS